MLPLDDLAEVASALARVDLDKLVVTDRRHHTLIELRFDGNGRGPLRFVNCARSLNKELKISDFDGEHTLSDIQQFYRSLRNCYVSSLRLHRQVIHPRELADLRAIRNDYAVNQAHLSSRDAKGTMHLLEAIPQCAALKWEYALTDDFFSHAIIRNVRYLNLVNCKNLGIAVQEWLHSTRENVGGRRLTLRQDKYDFDATELAHMLRNQFLDDTQSRDYQLLVYGNLRDGHDETSVNAVGDVLEVEAAEQRAFLGYELCMTRLSKHNAESCFYLVAPKENF
ncbi:hypothetical protein AAVH_19649 [Aphelenchoides avenae]|nr:hypothetical protein AAVH_19649 [Aphelenchus avenae]